MKAKVLKAFRDKDDFAQLYKPGDVIDLKRDRLQFLEGLGLVEEVHERKKQPEKETL